MRRTLSIRVLHLACAGACFVTFCAWMASGSHMAGWRSTTGYGVGIRSGCATIDYVASPPPGAVGPQWFRRVGWYSWRTRWRADQIRWIPQWDCTASGWRIYVPMWMPFVATGALTVTTAQWLSIQRWRWRRRGACLECGYALVGLPQCPECGTTAACAESEP